MMLFLDLETSGLLRRDRPIDDPAQPFIVSVAAELIDAQGKTTDTLNFRVRAPEGRKVQDAATNVHGITTRQAASSGISEVVALGAICGLASQARYVVGHAISFDRDTAISRLMQLGKPPRLLTRPGLEWIDTMQAAAQVCKLESDHESGGYRWPSLDEASEIILNEPRREGHHSAWDDCQRAKRLFLALRERGALEDEQCLSA